VTKQEATAASTVVKCYSDLCRTAAGLLALNIIN